MIRTPFVLSLIMYSLLSGADALGQFIVVNDSTGDGIADGPRQLMADTANQQVRIFATGGMPVQGLTFSIQIADGYPDGVPSTTPPGTVDGPNITNVDILGTASDPTIFQSNNTGVRITRSDEQVWSVTTTTSSGTVNAAGLLAIVTVDTRSWVGGTWDLRVSNTQEGPTDFADIEATITDGALTVVPEPSTCGFALGIALTAFALIRRHITRG